MNGPYVAQLLPDRVGAELLRKLLLEAISGRGAAQLSGEEEDAAHELYAKLTEDMRRKR